MIIIDRITQIFKTRFWKKTYRVLVKPGLLDTDLGLINNWKSYLTSRFNLKSIYPKPRDYIFVMQLKNQIQCTGFPFKLYHTKDIKLAPVILNLNQMTLILNFEYWIILDKFHLKRFLILFKLNTYIKLLRSLRDILLRKALFRNISNLIISF